MPTGEPIEEQVKDAVVVRLKTIASDASYRTTPQLVTRSLLWITHYNRTDMPVLAVVRASGTTMRAVAHPDAVDAGAMYLQDIRFAVWGYDVGDHEPTMGSVVVDTKLARLRDDTVQCLLSPNTLTALAGLVMNIFPDPDEYVDTDDGALEPFGYFKQIWLAQVYAPIPAAA